MGFKFIVTAPIVPFEIGQEVEFDEIPPQGMLFRLKAVEGKELVVATPQSEPEPEAPAVESEPEPEAEKPRRGR